MVNFSELRPIFVVDDDPDAGDLMAHLLSKGDVHNPLMVWTDSVKALDDWTAMERAGPFSQQLPLLFLIDLRMPGVSGRDLLAWLQRQPVLGTRPRVVMTSSLNDRDADAAYALGASGFLSKYPDPLVFASIVRLASDIHDVSATHKSVIHRPRRMGSAGGD